MYESRAKRAIKALIAVILVVVIIFVGVYFLSAKGIFDFGLFPTVYSINEKDVFIESKFGDGVPNVQKYDSKKIYLDVGELPSEYLEYFETAIFELSEELKYFEFVIVKNYDGRDIDFTSFTEKEHSDSTSNKEAKLNYAVGYCEYNSGKYDPIKKVIDFEDKRIAIDVFAFDKQIFQRKNHDEAYEFFSVDFPMYKRIMNTVTPSETGLAMTGLYYDILSEIGDDNIISDSRLLELKLAVKNCIDEGLIPERHLSDMERMAHNLAYAYKNSVGGGEAEFGSVVKHEMLHALFFAQDIDSSNSHFDDAESIMSYNFDKRTLDISDFDREKIIKPGLLLALSLNKKLCDENGIDQKKVIEYIEKMMD